MKHWSEKLACRCGATFRSALAEAKHRHNFPIYCRVNKGKKLRNKKIKEIVICSKHNFRHVDKVFTCPFCDRDKRNEVYEQQRNGNHGQA